MKFNLKYFILPKLILACVSLTGCEAPFSADLAPESDHQQIVITTGNNINEKLAIQIDLVQVYNNKVFEQLKTMDAKTFREQKDQLMLDNPDSFSIWTVDFIENQTKTYQLPVQRNYWGIIIYLHFIDNPQTRIIIPKNMKHLSLHIQEGEFFMQKEKHTTKYIQLKGGR